MKCIFKFESGKHMKSYTEGSLNVPIISVCYSPGSGMLLEGAPSEVVDGQIEDEHLNRIVLLLYCFTLCNMDFAKPIIVRKVELQVHID